MKNRLTSGRPIILYDGSCPLCRKEISHYRRMDKTHQLEWLDITSASSDLAAYGISFEAAMKRLHSIDGNGEVKTGTDSFMLIWSQLRYYCLLAKTIRVLKLQRPLEYLYQWFAEWRYERRCRDGCQIPR
jgi:predicted DCC family thiol-disulfide oxidoreductase YuxK